ncbi:hypothetical protein [Gordoniibacillus kamchatkensis]|uniref:hypothetical protein n=1 Tax=Gordoniibacillus kamchatkensis TaxID=1590651 RepID=UPI00069917C0|nr:hypothetical protein [Paenibacillus sp. VKM B-2647]
MVDTFVKHRSAEEGAEPTNPLRFGAYIGLFAGIIWGAVRIFEYYFRLTDVVPGFWSNIFSSTIF